MKHFTLQPLSTETWNGRNHSCGKCPISTNQIIPLRASRSHVAELHKIALFKTTTVTSLASSILDFCFCILLKFCHHGLPHWGLLKSFISLREKMKADTIIELMDSISEHLRAQRGENRNSAAWWDLYITPYFLQSELSLWSAWALFVLLLRISWAKSQHVFTVQWRNWICSIVYKN